MEAYKKRTLKKVRKTHLLKKAEEDEGILVDLATRILNKSRTNVIVRSIGLVETNREVFLDINFLNTLYKAASFQLDTRYQFPVATVQFKPLTDENSWPLEYILERLESYGDLKMALWAQRLKSCHTMQSKVMRSYFNFIERDRQEGSSLLKETKIRASFLVQDFESQQIFFKVRFLISNHSKELVSASFDQRFLEKIGHNLDCFESWVIQNGLPLVSKRNCSLNMKYAQAFLDCTLINCESIYQGPEYFTDLIDKNGTKEKQVLQTVFILEPSEEGIFLNTYCIIKENKRMQVEKGKESFSLQEKPGIKCEL